MFVKYKEGGDYPLPWTTFRRHGTIGLRTSRPGKTTLATNVNGWEILTSPFNLTGNAGDVIEFGDYAGRAKWERSLQVPHQSMRDALVSMITVQGDTEFASVEQQRHLLATAPTDYDRYAAARIMAEEQRHGWQMAYLLMTYFGQQGRREAQKLLERNAQDGDRLLGAFNRPMPHWLDFFCYTMFVDRDGKFQLGMLSTSAFKPLAASMGPMLKEESFHLGTGSNGLRRIIKAGVIPLDMLQRYINKWVATAHDLFGVDESSSAHWAYVWGIKGRWDERKKARRRSRSLERDTQRRGSHALPRRDCP